MRVLRISTSAMLRLAFVVAGMLITGCKRDVADLRFRNFSNDTVRLTIAYSHVRWYPESGYDLSQRNAGATPPVLVSGLGDSRNPTEPRIADSTFAIHDGDADSYLLPPAHTLWLTLAQAGAGMPTLLEFDRKGRKIQVTQDSIRLLTAEELSQDFY